MHRTQALVKQIQNFSQGNDETFATCWTRFKDLLCRCPHHGFDKFRQISICYGGLTPDTKKLVETMCSGKFLSLEAEEAEAHFEYVFDTSRSWDTTNPHNRTPPASNYSKSPTVCQISGGEESSALIAQLQRNVEILKMNHGSTLPESRDEPCVICEGASISLRNVPSFLSSGP